MSWLKKELGYIVDSISQIIKGFILFVCVTSGLGCALLLRHLGYNGTIIAFTGIVIEAICLFLSYLFFKKHFSPEEEGETMQKGKKSFK
jgi:multisubunit Na+/H+ antiporter MnhB subunit